MGLDLERLTETLSEDETSSFNRLNGKKHNKGRPFSNKPKREVVLKVMLTEEESEKLTKYAEHKETNKSAILQSYIRRLQIKDSE